MSTWVLRDLNKRDTNVDMENPNNKVVRNDQSRRGQGKCSRPADEYSKS